MHVLVVDDQQIDRYIIKKQLSADFKVTTLSSAREATAFALIHSFDVALLNVMLIEDMDCIAVLKNLERIQGKTFTAVAITCHIDSIRRQKLLWSGFKGILQKPFDVDEFKNLMHYSSASALTA